MVKLKNVRPGVLLIADARLRLAPGETVEVESLTPQTERALAAGGLIRVGVFNEAPALPIAHVNPPAVPSETEPVESDLSQLSAPEAISHIKAETDAGKLRALLGNEKRRSVLDVMRKRLAEVESGTQ